MIEYVRRSALRPSLALAAGLLALAACGTASRTSGNDVACQSCHGGASGNAAPPRAVTGETASTALGVGAHQAHLTRSTFAAPIQCGECHVVPQTAAEHVDGEARVVFSGRAVAGNGTSAVAAWDRDTATCSNVSCHGGARPLGGSSSAPTWNAAAQPRLDCRSCHGFPAPRHGPNAEPLGCHVCHPATVDENLVINVASGLHMDGAAQFDALAARCDGCHDAPPATGAHRVHVGSVDLSTLEYGLEWRTEDLDPTGSTEAYTFGCGSCHPKDVQAHRNGVVDVQLDPALAAPGSLRALNAPDAAYAGGSCSGVACHSSGQATNPVFAATPVWSSGEKTTCGSCHGNPPSYPNGGPDAQANSHIFLNFSGREAGHFAGLPGPTFHRSRHGAPTAFASPEQAAPITCQTCHADTVDPANVAEGGFFYLDTGITTRLAGGDPARLTDAAWKDTQCTTCHAAGGTAPVGQGRVRPLRHVNGAREVAFDGRTGADLPAGWFAGLGTSAPTRPYFMTGATFFTAYTLPAGAGWDMPAPPPAAGQRATLSYELSGAAWEPATKTCSSVACHLGNDVRWGQKDFETAPPTCNGCHALQ